MLFLSDEKLLFFLRDKFWLKCANFLLERGWKERKKTFLECLPNFNSWGVFACKEMYWHLVKNDFLEEKINNWSKNIEIITFHSQLSLLQICLVSHDSYNIDSKSLVHVPETNCYSLHSSLTRINWFVSLKYCKKWLKW